LIDVRPSDHRRRTTIASHRIASHRIAIASSHRARAPDARVRGAEREFFFLHRLERDRSTSRASRVVVGVRSRPSTAPRDDGVNGRAMDDARARERGGDGLENG